MADIIAPPPGFTLDPPIPALPEGFTLDPVAAPHEDDIPGDALSANTSLFSIAENAQEVTRHLQRDMTPDSLDRIVGAFGQGVSEGFGSGPVGLTPEAEKNLRDAGLLLTGHDGVFAVSKAFSDIVLRGLAAGIDLVGRVGGAATQGTAKAFGQVAFEVGVVDRPRYAERAFNAWMEYAGVVGAGVGVAAPAGIPRRRVEKAPEPAPLNKAEAAEVPEAFADVPVVADDAAPVQLDLLRQAEESDVLREPPKPVEVAPGLTEQRIVPGVSKNVVDAAEDLLLRGNVTRDSEALISDQITDLLHSGALKAAEIDEVLTRHGVTAPELAELFRSDIRKAAQSLQRLSALERRLTLADAIETVPAENLGKFLSEATKPSLREKLGFVWVNWLTANPVSQAANALGNGLVALTEVALTTPVAGVVGATRRGVFGGTGGVRLSEAHMRAWGLAAGTWDGMQAWWHVMRTGHRPPGSKVDITRAIHPLGRPASAIVGFFGTRSLTAIDELFKTMAYRSEINAQAVRLAAESGKTGKSYFAEAARLRSEPTDDMKNAAEKYALKQTFQEPGGPVVNAFLKLRRVLVGSELVMPFVSTPGAIFKYMGNHTPLGLMTRHVWQNLAGKHGKVAQDTQIAQLAVGAGIMTATGVMVQQGILTGGGSSDPAQRAIRPPYSIKIGDQWIGYRRFEPLGTIVGLVADTMEMGGEVFKDGSKDAQDTEKVLIGVLGATANALLSKTFTSSASEFLAAATRPERYGESYTRRFISGFVVPPGMATLARSIDPVVREARTTMDAIKARVPYKSEEVKAQRDVFGEIIVLPETLGPRVVSPIPMMPARNDPLLNELRRLEIWPAQLERQIRGVDLTPPQQEEYETVSGRLFKMALSQLVSAPGWGQVHEFAQKEIVIKLLHTAREQGRAYMLMRYPQILGDAIKLKTAPFAVQ